MTIQLAQSDFQTLSSIIQKLPDFINVRDRQRLLANALEGVSQSDIILGRLDLDGSPMGVSGQIIRFLADFGQVAYGKEALGVFLNYIQPFVGNENSGFILHLFQKYPLDTPETPSHLISLWKGSNSIGLTH